MASHVDTGFARVSTLRVPRWSRAVSSIVGALLAVALATGCGGDDDDGPNRDAGAALDAGHDAATDAAVDAGFRISCACDDEEDCPACIANIGRCCYGGDEAIEGAAPALASRCERNPGCQVCCRECAALSCEELQASSCPPPETDQE